MGQHQLCRDGLLHRYHADDAKGYRGRHWKLLDLQLRTETGQEAFDIPSNYDLECLLLLGYLDLDPSPLHSMRKSLNETVFYEHF